MIGSNNEGTGRTEASSTLAITALERQPARMYDSFAWLSFSVPFLIPGLNTLHGLPFSSLNCTAPFLGDLPKY